METKLMILFDGYCNLCSWAVKFAVAHDKQGMFSFIALQSQKGQLILAQFNLSSDSVNSMVLIQGDQFYTKSTAVLRMCKVMKGWPRLLTVFLFIPRPLRDLLYDLVAKNRYQLFGRRNTCYRI